LGVFDDLTVFYGRVPPGLQAVICRVLAEAGERDMAKKASQSIDEEILMPHEKLLIEGLN